MRASDGEIERREQAGVMGKAPSSAAAAVPGGVGPEVTLERVSKRFGQIAALREASLGIAPGEAVAITGRSGSGKSTLLAMIGGLEQPDSGSVLIDGRAVWRQRHQAHARRELVGFVFQRHHLLEALSARANVEVPLIGSGMHRRARRSRALELLADVGLSGRAEHVPAELSGGERQRVAIARALANEPRLLLADEPTGALDTATSATVLDLIFTLRDRRGMTLVIVSYDEAVSARAERTVRIVDGRVLDQGIPARATV
ncbi:MAG TPA: ABC transporter ATP-binding protein [Solirubrobacteraceae bacterium]|nr:ABC transporter ATP-binding protein [Solirubrobacteraceae bacterium]